MNMSHPTSRPLALSLRPLAFLKLLYFCQAASTEIGGFGISSEHDLLTLDDIVLIRQRASLVSVVFDDAAVADHFDMMAETGIAPNRCGRVWIHTHPADSASPSLTDEQTFASSFGHCDFSVMAILARGGQSYARLQFSAGPGGQMLLPMQMRWTDLPRFLQEHRNHLPGMIQSWQDQLENCVIAEPGTIHRQGDDRDWPEDWQQLIQQRMEEDQAWFMDDLAVLEGGYQDAY